MLNPFVSTFQKSSDSSCMKLPDFLGLSFCTVLLSLHRTSNSYLPNSSWTTGGDKDCSSSARNETLPRSFGANMGPLHLYTSLSSGMNSDNKVAPKSSNLVSRAWSLKDACRPKFSFLSRQTSDKTTFIPITKSTKRKGASTHYVETIKLEDYIDVCDGY